MNFSRNIFRTLCYFSILLLLTACPHVTNLIPTNVDNLADTSGLSRKEIKTAGFTLSTWSKPSAPGSKQLHVYIEGDGRAWIRKNRLSSDPTPKDPVALRLAIADPHPNVSYLARPCQYTRAETFGICEPRYWSSHRYSDEIIKAMDQTLNQLKKHLHQENSSLVLIGYSGGGVIAALLAARRTDVDSFITVASNLDHNFWTNHHNISPLKGSLNPVDFNDDLQWVSQLHFVGGKDDIVPERVVTSYMDTLNKSLQARHVVIADADHHCCWVKQWPQLLKRYLPLKN